MISIYGSPRSSAGRCFWCLEEAGVKYEYKEVNMREKEHKSQLYLDINPNGKVPALTDGDYKIWESMAINNYIALTYKPELLGSSDKIKGHVHQWSFWSLAELQPPMIDIFIQKVFVPEDRRSQEVIDKALAKLPNLFSILEKTLSKQKFVAGDEFTIGDINTASVVAISQHIGASISDYPSITGWLEGMNERDAYRRYMDLCK